MLTRSIPNRAAVRKTRAASSAPSNGRQLARRRYAATAGDVQDVVVIGGGPGGYVGAIKAAQLGLKVTCVEKRGKLGGTCLNVGCIPSKALLQTSHLFEMTKHYFPQHGIMLDNARIDVAKMQEAKVKSVNGLTAGVESLFKKYKVTYSKGHGKIVSPTEVEVTGEDGAASRIKTKNIIIATGSDASSLPGIEIDEKKIITSTGALELTEVPKTMILIGGGVIGLEMGSVWSRLGAKVTIIEFTNAICAGADAEVATSFQRVLKKQGMEFRMRSKVLEAKKTDKNTVIVKFEDLETKQIESMEVDVVLVAVGRKPHTTGLGLETVGVKTERGMVVTDDHFRTNVPGIYAIGDVIKGPMLAHKAEEEGIAVVESLVTPGAGHVNYNAIPSVIYTHPEVAWVGHTEEQLKAKGIDYKIGKFPFLANSRAKTIDDKEGFVKFLADKTTDRVLGVHIIGPNAGELISEATLAIEYGASSEDVARTCHAHPTLSEATKEAAHHAAFGTTINF